MIRAVFLAAIVIVFFSGCDSVPAVAPTKFSETPETVAQRTMLVGTWKGEAPIKTGGSRSWTITRLVDGTVRTDFQETYPSGLSKTHSETGIWGTSAGIYFTATTGFIHDSKISPADTTDPSLYDVYRINRLTGSIFEYQNLSTGNSFTVKRIVDSPTTAP